VLIFLFYFLPFFKEGDCMKEIRYENGYRLFLTDEEYEVLMKKRKKG